MAAGERGSSLDELIRERMSRLDPQAVEVLQWAAVLAPRLDIAALVRATGTDAERIGEVLVLAEHQALLEPDEFGFRFCHDLLVQSILADISPTRRRMIVITSYSIHYTKLYELRMARGKNGDVSATLPITSGR